MTTKSLSSNHMRFRNSRNLGHEKSQLSGGHSELSPPAKIQFRSPEVAYRTEAAKKEPETVEESTPKIAQYGGFYFHTARDIPKQN